MDSAYADGLLPPIDFASALNEEQLAAVTAEPGPALILAGAGSGKTRTLTYRVAYLLHKGVRPQNILLLTFTNKAAREMLDRVEDLTGVSRRYFWGGTFHSVGQRILRQHGETIGLKRNFNILDEGEAEGILKEAIQQIDPKFLKSKDNPKAKLIHNLISYARNTCRLVADEAKDRFLHSPTVAERIAEFYERYRELKLEQQVSDYDDLLEYLLQLLQQNAEVRDAYQNLFRHILVDEYQDTNQLQSRIIDALSGQYKQVMAVGDDAQCIYTWRGADFENIMSFTDRYEGACIHKIETNYRSSPEILNFANAVLNAQPYGMGFNKELRAVRPSDQRPYFVPVMDASQQAQFIITRVRGLLEEGRDLKDIAVLYRAHYHAMELQMELTRSGIDFEITSGVRFFEQAHIRDLAAHLRLVSNPADVSAFSRLAALLPRVGPKTASRLHRLAEVTAQKENISFFEALSSETIAKKVPKDAIDDWTDLTATLLEVDQAKASENASELVKLAIDGWYGTYIRHVYQNYQDREDDLLSLVSFAAPYDTLTEFLAQLVLLASETAQRTDEEKRHSMRLTTIHQSKGLEFPIVFVLGLADGLFPLRRTIEDGNIEEERRLFYVSVTRAEDELYLMYPLISTQGGGAMRMKMSRFMGEVSPTHYEVLRTNRPAW